MAKPGDRKQIMCPGDKQVDYTGKKEMFRRGEGR